MMENGELRKYLHDVSNALNAAKINAYLLRRMHGEVLDREAADGLDSSLFDAERLLAELHRHAQEDILAPAIPATVTN